MKVKGILIEDFVNYKKPSFFIGFSKCTWKCEKECGQEFCQNKGLAALPDEDLYLSAIDTLYFYNPVTEAIVCGGLEPFDSPTELINLLDNFRAQCDDDFVIYTGYTEEELSTGKFNGEYLPQLKQAYFYITQYKNIIIKYGRYIPNRKKRFDDVLGVWLASDNQYAVKYG